MKIVAFNGSPRKTWNTATLLNKAPIYSDPPQSLFPKKIPSGFIYTMNCKEEQTKAFGCEPYLNFNDNMMRRIFGSAEFLMSFDTYQFEDYSKVVAPRSRKPKGEGKYSLKIAGKRLIWESGLPPLTTSRLNNDNEAMAGSNVPND